MKIWKDRRSAGKLLAARLKNIKADLVLGIPRGGVVVAAEVAKDLHLPLDIVVTRKLGAPGQEELALGALDPDGEVVWEKSLIEDLRLKIDDLKDKVKQEAEEIKRRENLYRQGKESLNLKNKVVILADDGMATGATIFSAIKYLKRHQARIVLAIPVTSNNALEKVKNDADKYVVLEIPEYFQAVGQFYHQFEPVTDKEVIQLLNYG